MNSRGSAVVSKLLEMLVALLYISVIAMLLFGMVVPAYQSAAADELAERILAESATEIQEISAAADQDRRTIQLPQTINGEPYRIEATSQELKLYHPSFQYTQPVVVTQENTTLNGTWQSNESVTMIIEYEQRAISIKASDDAQ